MVVAEVDRLQSFRLVPEESPRNSGYGVVGEVDRPEVVDFGQEVFRKRAEKVV